MGVTFKPTEFKQNSKSDPGSERSREKHANMSLSDKDKANVKALWAKISKSADAVGTDALNR